MGIDIATVSLWVYTAFLLWVLGDLWFGRGRGWLTMLMTLFGGELLKFGVVASIAMGLASSAAVDWALRALPGQRLSGRVGRGAISAALVLAATCGGLAFALFFALFPETAPRFFNRRCARLGSEDTEVASFIRARIRAGEIVYRRQPPAVGYAQWAGLPVPWLDWAVYTFDFPKEHLDGRVRLLKELPPAPGAYLAQGIQWFVLDAIDEALNAHADRWISSGSAVELMTTSRLRVVKLAGH